MQLLPMNLQLELSDSDTEWSKNFIRESTSADKIGSYTDSFKEKKSTSTKIMLRFPIMTIVHIIGAHFGDIIL